MHLDHCPECRRFADRCAHVTRLARTEPVAPLPRLSTSVPHLVASALPPRRRGWRGPLRVLLVVLGLGQLGLATGELFAAAGEEHNPAGIDGASLAHFSHESSAWNFGLAVGFLCVAARPSRTRGLVPLVAAFVSTLTALSALDLAFGKVSGSRLISHGVAVLGLVVLLALARATAGPSEGTPGRADSRRLRPLRETGGTVTTATTEQYSSWAGGSDVKPSVRDHAA